MADKLAVDEEQLVDNDELAYNAEIPTHSCSHNIVCSEDINPDINSSQSAHVENEQSKIANDQSQTPNGVHALPDVRTPITNAASGDAQLTDATHPVYYSSKNGNARVVQEHVVVTREDGTRSIEIEEMRESEQIRRLAEEVPLRQRRMRLLKVFAVVAIVVFFPCGIPAFYYSVKTEIEYHRGMLRGDIDLARKYARLSERFSILAGLLGLLTAILALALIERMLVMQDEDYWKSSRTRLLLH